MQTGYEFGFKHLSFSFEEFAKELEKGQYMYEFIYKSVHIYIYTQSKGFIKKNKRWYIVVNRHDNTPNIINASFDSAESLLKNARVDGKMLREVWHELRDAAFSIENRQS